MSFPEEERRAWHEAKSQREMRTEVKSRRPAVTICVHCGQPSGYGEGYISDAVSLCDLFDGN